MKYEGSRFGIVKVVDAYEIVDSDYKEQPDDSIRYQIVKIKA